MIRKEKIPKNPVIIFFIEFSWINGNEKKCFQVFKPLWFGGM
jgi:hypothetical protein